MWYSVLADVIVAVHVAYVAYVVLGQLAILIGLVVKWAWVRNLWFRLTHLAAISFVALEAIWKVECPLTVWEQHLRHLAGEEVSEASFIGRCLDSLIFHNFDQWVFDVTHITFALLVLATFILAPPRWPKRRLAA